MIERAPQDRQAGGMPLHACVLMSNRVRAEGVSQGSLVRRALKAYGVTAEAPKAKSGYEVIKRFLGRSHGGSKDLSTNPKHLAGYGR